MLAKCMLQRIYGYLLLMRWHKPIGILLCLWPPLWALWLAGAGKPSFKNLCIFVLGTIVMRSAGCVINDFADRNFDGRVARTRNRPLVTGRVSVKEAWILFASLLLIAFLLVLSLNALTVKLAFIGVLLACIYPFMKRYMPLPQVVLGLPYNWGVPMAFAAELNQVPKLAWAVFSIACLWTVIYDTFYAMTDREDDKKIGLKSTAILFGSWDKKITAILQLIMWLLLLCLGKWLNFDTVYFIACFVVLVLMIYQQYLIKDRIPAQCFRAFINNNWLGLSLFVGIALNYYLSYKQ